MWMNMVNNGWRGQRGQLAMWKLKRPASRGDCLAHLFPAISLYLSHANTLHAAGMYICEQTRHICIQTCARRHTQTHIWKESQLPFETFWCVNKHLRAFQPNKTNFQSSTNSVGPVATLAFLFFRGTAQLICHHKSRPRDPAKISEPLQQLASGERRERDINCPL